MPRGIEFKEEENKTNRDNGVPDSPASLNMENFPSLVEITCHFSAIFAVIANRDHEEVEKFLADKGVEVDIVPKVGCSPLHYTKFNVANCVNSFGDTPLIMAAKIDCEMVNIVLKYGGNPNDTNQDRSSPLSVAAVRGDRESIDALMMAGANLTAAVIKLTSYLRYQADSQIKDSQNKDTGFSVKSLTFLLYDGVYLKCRDPFRTAFDVSQNIEEIENVRDEFKTEFQLLIRDADVFAYRLLDHCDKMWEAREVLDSSDGLLRRAIDERKMRFVAHPFSQQIILEEWYGKLAFKWAFGKLSVVLKYIFSPLLLPFYLLEYFLIQKYCNKIDIMESKCADHMRLLFTPFMCFITDVLNYFILLGLLISVCVIPKDRARPNNWELVLWVCLLSRLLIELDQMVQQGLWRYLKNIFNFIELIACAVLLAATFYRIYIWSVHKDDDKDLEKMKKLHDDILNVTYFYAFAEVIIILRWLNFLEISASLGPLLLALKYLLVDVVKFVSIVLLTCVLGASIAVYAITNNISVNGITLKTTVDDMTTESITKDQILQKHGLALKEVPKYFGSFVECLKSIIWATFGLLEMPDIEIKNDAVSSNIIHILMMFYVLLACVMMLNMLIALLNNTFEKIQDNCDIEWKNARSELLKEYRNGQPFLFPFNIILIPVTIWFRRRIETRKRVTLPDLTLGEEQREKLLSELCKRYSFYSDSQPERRGSNTGDMQYYPYSRRDTFVEVAAIQRHKSFMRSTSGAGGGKRSSKKPTGI